MKVDIWGSFDPRLAAWFRDNIGDPTPTQVMVWTYLKEGRDVLVVSPTGSGKTLAAVLPALDPILKGVIDRSKTAILYISPMKALGADVLKTLTNLSEGLGGIEGRKVRKWGRGRKRTGDPPSDANLQIGIRTGDVPQSERRRMLLDPPDLMVTTPENLLLMLCSKARETLDTVGWVIIDEVHEMVPSKRGSLLALTLELLSDTVFRKTGREPVRIGLSATVRPEGTAAKYLGGMGSNGRTRPVKIIKEDSVKEMVIEFRTLIGDMREEIVHRDLVLDEIDGMLRENEGPLVVFHNTRRAAEEMAYSLIRRGFDDVMPHHGSLGADVRRSAEEGLKNGDLRAIISSTSLELGIDIGEVDRVCQISSPKDPSRLLQRFGRSGHGLGRTSHGLIYPEDGVDLLEALAVSMAATKGKLERLRSPVEPLDVLAQFAIGMSLAHDGTTEDGLWRISRKAYPFRSLKKTSLHELLELLTHRLPGPDQPSARLWFDEEKVAYLPRRNTGQAFYLNCGTIPKETSYRVLDERTKKVIGDLSRDFGETLYERDVILLGSKPCRITGFSGTKILVHEEPEAQPTVPSWSGEVMPRAQTVTTELMRLYSKGCDRRGHRSSGIRFHLDENGRSICRSVIRELTEMGLLPTPQRIPVEFKRLKGSRRLYIFLLPRGRKVTEMMGRVLVYGLRRSIGALVEYTATDDGFAVITPKQLTRSEIISALDGGDLENVAKGLILTSSIFRSRFTHCMNKSLLVLSRFRGRDTGAMYKRNRVEKLLGLVMDSWYSEKGWGGAKGPLRGLIALAEEALKEIYTERIDIKTCKNIVYGARRGTISVDLVEMREGPSILGMSIIGSWKGRVKGIGERTDKVEGAPGERLDQKAPIQFIPPLDDEAPSEIDRMRVARAVSSCRERYDRGKSGVTGTEGNDGRETDMVLSLGGSAFGPEAKERIPLVPFDTRAIPGFRRYRMSPRPGNLGSVIRWVPFFTHPIEIVQRSENISFNDIRSSMKSGRILPVRIAGGDRSSDRRWAMTFRSMTDDGSGELFEDLRSEGASSLSRSELRQKLGSTGNDLTSFLNEAMERKVMGRFPTPARDMIGDARSDFIPIPCEDMSCTGGKNGLSGLERFLRFFGPFEMDELIFLFGPDVMGRISVGIEKGIIRYGMGSPGPLSERPEGSGIDEGLWVWSPRGHKDVISWTKSWIETPGLIRLQTSTDPSTLLTGKWRVWVEDQRIRGGSTVIVLAFKGEEMIGRATVVETLDLVRVSDLEVDDFDTIVDISRALIEFLKGYERLGFRAFLVERIMGISAGDAARGGVDVFLENGYQAENTPIGMVLIKGAEAIRGISREDILYQMFRAQGMIEESHWSHPLEVISKLGSVVDRWEILSRMGSSRYRHLSLTDPQAIADMNIVEWERSTGNSTCRGDGHDWSEILTSRWMGLSDMKDLAKRHSLVRGMMDQPYPVWSLEKEFERYPPPSKGRLRAIGPELQSLLSSTSGMGPSDMTAFIRSRDGEKEAEELLRHGLMVEGPWGEVRNDIIKFPGRKRGKAGPRSPSRGLAQCNWIKRNATRLSLFTLEDLLNYSPGLEDPGKVRSVLNDIVGRHLKRYITVSSGYRVIYSTIRDLTDLPKYSPDRNLSGELIMISPKDRMARVVMNDIKGTIARGHGFSIFAGGRPVALVSLQKLHRPVKNTGFGEKTHGSSSLEYWTVKKAWMDLGYRRKDMFKVIRKAFYDLGCQLITDDEKLRIESLYRDVEKGVE
ncbi:MAG: DEAD/DEAH box helicase [Candidatus Thermoplasmatota archaeon]|nr:DEAD/DEAH box helicase [Candidatus Thermoplasmatota archaeon]